MLIIDTDATAHSAHTDADTIQVPTLLVVESGGPGDEEMDGGDGATAGIPSCKWRFSSLHVP